MNFNRKRRVLITGAGGFTGRHLIEKLRQQDDKPTLIGTGSHDRRTLAVDEYIGCDVTDGEAVEALIDAADPDVVYHLAAVNAAAGEEKIHDVNVVGFTNLCAALKRLQRSIRMVTIGSAAEIGSAAAKNLPVDERVVCVPESAYGRSKWLVTQHALSESVEGGLEIVVARTFNLVGPGMSGQLSLGRFARQIAAVRRGETDSVRCGPLHTRRDFLDVRDAVEAYMALAERATPGRLYNVCTGQSHCIGDLLQKLIEQAGVAVRVFSEPKTSRPGDLLDIYGNRSRIGEETGWSPRLSIEQSLLDLYAAVDSTVAEAA